MKRYNLDEDNTYQSPTGAWMKVTDHLAERAELYETIDRNSKKIIKLTEQNREMLEGLKYVRSFVTWKANPSVRETIIAIIEKVEGE